MSSYFTPDQRPRTRTLSAPEKGWARRHPILGAYNRPRSLKTISMADRTDAYKHELALFQSSSLQLLPAALKRNASSDPRLSKETNALIAARGILRRRMYNNWVDSERAGRPGSRYVLSYGESQVMATEKQQKTIDPKLPVSGQRVSDLGRGGVLQKSESRSFVLTSATTKNGLPDNRNDNPDTNGDDDNCQKTTTVNAKKGSAATVKKKTSFAEVGEKPEVQSERKRKPEVGRTSGDPKGSDRRSSSFGKGSLSKPGRPSANQFNASSRGASTAKLEQPGSYQKPPPAPVTRTTRSGTGKQEVPPNNRTSDALKDTKPIGNVDDQGPEAKASGQDPSAAAGDADGAMMEDGGPSPVESDIEEGDVLMEEEEEDAGKEIDQRLIRVLSGYLDDLPPIARKVVRIFTSSTFTDTTLERNCLMEGIYPKLKEYCREKHGLDFQVVDMRWGVRDEATDDHMTTDLCMNEIDNCQRLSLGPNFCVFLGQKYGYRPIPTIIPASEFEMMRDVIATSCADAPLLDQWYRKDENAVPPVYILQPISSILPNFNNKRTHKLMERDQATWWDIMGKMQVMLRKGALELFMDRKMDREQMHNYVMSVTEREVRRGIINAKDTQKHCLAYIRNIENINVSSVKYARNFVDMIGRDVDEEAEYLLSILRDELLPTRLVDSNIVHFTVEWSRQEGLDVDTHRDYLRQFCEIFYRDITDLVDRGVSEVIRYGYYERLFGETLHHLHSCQSLCKVFSGREEILDSIHQYVTGPTSEPLILWGESGCGKTSLLAKGFSLVRDWLSRDDETIDPLTILRFLGTSPDSSSIIPLLTSICNQIWFHFNHSLDQNVPSDLNRLVSYFRSLLALATTERPISLFLDSVDQLSPADGAHHLSWFPLTLPAHCKLVVSVVSNYFGILDRLRRILDHPSSFIDIPPLGVNLAIVVIRAWLAGANRTVSAEQWSVVEQVLEGCNIPLFTKMVFGEISRWRSYYKPYLTTLAVNIHDSVIKLFERIENQHGRVLVSRAFGYVTLSKGGLTETELEDLLSLDEQVLNDVYQYHLPPVRRIPPLLWTRIRNDLSYYFTEREADGVNVIDWYHREFDEVSRERYFRNLNVLHETHSSMADYFLGIWGGVPKPFQYTELQCQRFGLESPSGSCDRKVPEQPVFFTDAKGKVTRYNLRKLSELPYHLIRAERYDDLYREILFNFRWLHSKLTCLPLQSILEDFEDALGFELNPNVKLLSDTLRLSASVLRRNPDMLGPQIVGRLLPYYDGEKMIRDLIRDCDDVGLKVNALIPCHHCMHTPGGPLQYSLEGHQFAPFGVAITADERYVVSVSSVFVIWDLTTGDVFRQMSPGIQGLMRRLVVAGDDRRAVTYTNNNVIVVAQVLTGDFRLIEDVVSIGEREIVDVSANSSSFVVWSPKDWFHFTLEGRLVASDSLVDRPMSIVYMALNSADDRFLFWKKGRPLGKDGQGERENGRKQEEEEQDVEDEDDESTMTMEMHCSSGAAVQPLVFRMAFALSKDRGTIFVCADSKDGDVQRLRRHDERWTLHHRLENSGDKIYSLVLSFDETYIVGVVAPGFKTWDLKIDELKVMELPTGVRNIPNKTCTNSLVVFTKDCELLVASVRKILYIWSVEDATLVQVLDVHFGRIVTLSSVTHGMNKLVSSSIDKSIKVWTVKHILEQIHPISRQEKSIDSISVSAAASNEEGEAPLVVTSTRSGVGVWNTENGRLVKTLTYSQHISIVTHALVTKDAKYVVSAESGNLLIWDQLTSKVLKLEKQSDMLQMMLDDNDTKLLALSRAPGEGNRVLCVCRSIPSSQTLYHFEYPIKAFRGVVIACDGVHLVAVGVNRKGHETLMVYAKDTGTLIQESRPKFSSIKGFHRIVAMPRHAHRVAFMGEDRGHVYDWKKRSFVKSLSRWNGTFTKDGRCGLYSPSRGGLEMLDLKTGNRLLTLIPRVAEGVFSTRSIFTANDQHVVYYHSGRRSVRVFRVSDGVQIADYKSHAEITALASSEGGLSVILGGIDGSLVILAVADPTMETNRKFLESMHGEPPVSPSPSLEEFL